MQSIFSLALVGMASLLVGCDDSSPSTTDSNSTPLATAIQKFKDNAAREDEAANSAHAADSTWTSAGNSNTIGLITGQSMITNAERSFLSNSCEHIHNGVDLSKIRIDQGGHTPTITCGLLNGATITIKFDAAGNPHKAH